jgi:hypothetical protein
MNRHGKPGFGVACRSSHGSIQRMNPIYSLDRQAASKLASKRELLPTLQRKLDHNLQRDGFEFRECAETYSELARELRAAVIFPADVTPAEARFNGESIYSRKYRAAIKLGTFFACIVDVASLRMERHGNRSLRGYYSLDRYNAVHLGARVATGFDTVARSARFKMRSNVEALDSLGSNERTDTLHRVADALAFARMDDALLASAILRAVLEAGTLAILLPRTARTLTANRRNSPPCAELERYIVEPYKQYARTMPASEVAEAIRPYLVG